MVKIKNIMQDREINRHKSLREFIQFANEKAKYLTSICLAGLILVLFQPNTLYAQSYSLSVDKLGTGSGTVTSSPAGIDCGSDCDEVYGATTVVTLTAAPDVGFVFAGWSGDCLGTGPCIVTMDSSKDITATFNPSIPSILSGDYHLVRDNYIGTYTFDGVGNVSFEYWTHPYDPAIYHYIAGTASYAVTTAGEVTVSNIHYTDGTPSTPADPAACFQYGGRVNADGSFLALNNVSSTCTEAPGSILRLLFSVLDGDSDGLPDQWERAYGLNPLNASDAALDSDGDGLTNLQEYQLGTNPNVADQGISGRVTDASNPTLGIANVDVWAQDLNGYWMGGTRTDSNGNYIFNLPVGDYKVGFDPGAIGGYYLFEFYNNKRDFNEGNTVTVLAAQTTPNMDAQLEMGGKISGQVTDTSSPPVAIANISVSACDSSGYCRYGTNTDNNGNYTLLVSVGAWKISFNNWQGTGFYLSEWYENKSNPADATPVGVTAGQDITGINAQLENGGKISGRVTDASNPTVGIANVQVSSGNGMSPAQDSR